MLTRPDSSKTLALYKSCTYLLTYLLTSSLKFMPIILRTSHCAFALPTAITSTNIHLFYDVYLTGRIGLLAMLLSLLLVSCFSVLDVFH